MPDRAWASYAETLGLLFKANDDYSPVFDLCGVPLRVQNVRELQPQPFAARRRVGESGTPSLSSRFLVSDGVFERSPNSPQNAHDFCMPLVERASRGSRTQVATCFPLPRPGRHHRNS